MGALSHFIEREGVATTGISLVREHTEYIRPPRALWVPFYLGRPFGVPGDADFQRNVLRASLDLLATATEPALADYPVEAPAETFSDQWACPISFAAGDAASLGGRLRTELRGLAPWWREAHRKRGRTLVGGSGGGPEDVDAMAELLSAVVEGAPLEAVPPAADHIRWGHSMPYLIRHVAQDLRSYYQEAAAAQPCPDGLAPSHLALNKWIFEETVLGEVILEVGRRLGETGDARLGLLRGWLIPEGFWPDGPTWGFDRTAARRDESRMDLADRAMEYLGRRP